jgi:hypothetical protein
MSRRLALACLILCPAALAGCGGGKGLPDLHPVGGVVTRSGRPVPAHVQLAFVPDAEIDITITGFTDDQGRFTLTSNGPDGVKKTGIPEGNYTVKVMFPMDEKQSGGEIVRLPQKIEIKPGGNPNLNIDVPPPEKRR